MKVGNWDIGVCSWSLQADIADVADIMKDLGLNHIHLAIRPALGENGDKYLAIVDEQSWTISSTMINFPQEDYSTLDSIKITGGVAPDEYWPANQMLFRKAAQLTAELKVKYISMHAGFIDHTYREYIKKFTERIVSLADFAAENNIVLLLETGQEHAEELRRFLAELNHPALGVNFDPANMILYDKGDPIEAVRVLAPWIKHIHIKDAIRTQTPGMWGAEVPWGRGGVRDEDFLTTLKKIGYNGVLAIEREAGNDRVTDIASAIKALNAFIG